MEALIHLRQGYTDVLIRICPLLRRSGNKSEIFAFPRAKRISLVPQERISVPARGPPRFARCKLHQKKRFPFAHLQLAEILRDPYLNQKQKGVALRLPFAFVVIVRKCNPVILCQFSKSTPPKGYSIPGIVFTFSTYDLNRSESRMRSNARFWM